MQVVIQKTAINNQENNQLLQKFDKSQDKAPQQIQTIQKEAQPLIKTIAKGCRHVQHQENKQHLKSQICTKYNSCIQAPFNLPNKKPKEPTNLFDYPQQILINQLPQQISIIPQSCPNPIGNHQIDLLIERNLAENKESELKLKNKEKNKLNNKYLQLQKLRCISQQKLKQCQKKPLNEQKRNKWGHSIFCEHKQVISENKVDKNNEKEQERQKEGEPTFHMKPIKERIKQYKNKQKKKLHSQNISKQCIHYQQKPQNSNTNQLQKIKKNSKKILQQLQKQKKEQQEKKKIIKAKIHAIELSSRNNLQKCKKKPIDHRSQFVIEIGDQGKKMESKKENIGGDAQRGKIIGENGNMQMNKTDNLQKKMRKISKNSTNKDPQQKTSNLEESPQQQSKSSLNAKFYIWNIPIYQDDYKTIQSDIHPPNPSNLFIKSHQQKSFRTEVRQYLQKKNHLAMKHQQQLSKQNKFKQLVEQKKKLFVQEFDHQLPSRNIDQVFWNEDQIYKLHPIKNF